MPRANALLLLAAAVALSALQELPLPATAHPEDESDAAPRRVMSTAVSPKLNAMAAAAMAAVQPKACANGACAATDCTLAPALTEGPYYWSSLLVRSNITEGKPGIPLVLRLTVVNTSASATSCVPLAGAVVDIWQCDALGVYSHYVSGSQSVTDASTFLRGVQRADSNGLVTFSSIYPGWYVGRTIHAHLKVHVGGVYDSAAGTYSGGTVAFTSQLFFNDTVTEAIATYSPYSSRLNVRRTRDTEDSIYAAQMISSLQFIDPAAGYSGGLIASLTLGVTSGAARGAVPPTIVSVAMALIAAVGAAVSAARV